MLIFAFRKDRSLEEWKLFLQNSVIARRFNIKRSDIRQPQQVI